MSTFTIPLKKVIEYTGGTVTLDLDTGISVLVGGNIGLSYYPIFDATYRAGLTGKIVDHYWNREIGQETIEMFQLAMRRKMNEIMPIYNQLYLSTQIEYGALNTVDLHTVNSNDNVQHATNATTSDTGSKSRAVQSETPQTMLSGDGDYATAATDAISDTTGVSNATEDSTNTLNGDNRITGYQGVASDLVMRYRESLLNIDLMIINDLEELFMLVWDNGDSYTNGGYYL